MTVSQMGPAFAMGPAKAQGSKAKLAESSQSHPEQLELGTKRHKGWPAARTSSAPSSGLDILKLCI
jgi:hypothetical protein